jgi:nuclear transport factor 2 (NTF2) superfamily protein
MSSHYQKYIKPRLENDEEYRKKHNAKSCEYVCIKYQTDEEFRKRSNMISAKSHKKRWDTDPEYREKKKRDMLNRYYAKKNNNV